DPNVQPHAGEVMGAPRVYAVFAGQDWGSANGLNASGQQMESDLQKLLADSKYFSQLAQYNVGKQPQYMGHSWINWQEGPLATLDEGNILDILSQWVDNGLVAVKPDYNEMNLVYLIFWPHTITLESDSMTCGQITGFHGDGFYRKIFGKQNLFFAAICYGSGMPTVSHELVETFTDRSANGWWSPGNKTQEAAEIGDICNRTNLGTVVTADGLTAASYWLREESRCLQQSDVT